MIALYPLVNLDDTKTCLKEIDHIILFKLSRAYSRTLLNRIPDNLNMRSGYLLRLTIILELLQNNIHLILAMLSKLLCSYTTVNGTDNHEFNYASGADMLKGGGIRSRVL